MGMCATHKIWLIFVLENVSLETELQLMKQES